ncbi:hypothetical protein Q7P36_005916 [Cladosporium allicinum]
MCSRSERSVDDTLVYLACVYRAQPTLPLNLKTIESLGRAGEVLMVHTASECEAHKLVEECRSPDGITISSRHGLIFWTEMGRPGCNDGAIYRASLDGSNASSLLPSGACHTPKQITVDEIGEKLYFSDREGLRVHRVNLDGTNHEIVVQTGDWQSQPSQNDATLWCIGVAVSHKLGKIYWTQKGPPKSSRGRLLATNLSMPPGLCATTRTDIEVIAKDLPEPIDLDIDEDEGYIYWSDRGELPFGNTLNKMALSDCGLTEGGQLRPQILAQGFGEAIGLRVDKVNDCVWVADMCGRLWRCDRYKAAAKVKVFEDDHAVLAGLAVRHSTKVSREI